MIKKTSFLLLFLFIQSFLNAQDFTIDSFIADIIVNKDGRVQVTENIYTDFHKEKHGLYRIIPYVFSNNGNKYKTEIEDINVEGRNSKTKSKNGSVELKIGDANAYVIGKQLYKINYVVQGPFISTDTFQEFYWNITGNEWKAPINKVKYKIIFPEAAAIDGSNMKIFTGQTHSTIAEGSIIQERNIVYGMSSRALAEGEGLTIAIRMPAKYIPDENTMTIKAPIIRQAVPTSKQWPLAAAVLAFLGGIVAFWQKLRGKGSEEETIPQAYPPLDLTPAEVGAFYDHIVHDRDIVSMLPYWANQGFLSMSYNANYGEISIKKIKDLDQERPPYEYTLFNAIFNFGNEVALSDLKEKFYSSQAKVKSQIKKEIIDLDMYDENYSFWFKSWRVWILIPILLPMFIAAFIFGYWIVGIALIITIVAVIILSSIGRKPSEKGQRVKQDLKGFLAFLKNDNSPEYEAIVKKDPQYFEKVYPYAVAFNLDKNFINKIRPYQSSAPFWFGYYGIHSHTPFNDFSDHFKPKEIVSAFTSYPASSGGGGTSGGGFSGGGFGGGGGGSW